MVPFSLKGESVNTSENSVRIRLLSNQGIEEDSCCYGSIFTPRKVSIFIPRKVSVIG
eukprot:CAMPEP_0114524372 /NCGR_PEP_ID=MMETSP0109-20121206/21820_1 /TAXON_ID=29199 /ORGANISM="Chlorarachnion reptans, Strain CCCM449" /LENGTH=56 /DNA_ID=CAMNT_0001705811 /DNA_START=422 /DNA_END=592 /DNA_ORIENTATION=+